MQRAPPSAPGGAPVPPMHSWWWTSASGAQRRCAPDARPGMRAPCAPRTHVVQSCCPSLSAVRTPEPRRGFPTLREGFSPTARGAYRMYCSLSISPQSPQAGGTPALPGRTWCDHAAHRSQRGERQSPAGASPRSGRASARTSNVARLRRRALPWRAEDLSPTARGAYRI